jgi:hypothetical protein
MSNIDHGQPRPISKIGGVCGGCLTGEAEMEKFVHRENIKLYRKLLAETTDAQKRQMILKLLADEEAKDERPPGAKQG